MKSRSTWRKALTYGLTALLALLPISAVAQSEVAKSASTESGLREAAIFNDIDDHWAENWIVAA